MSLRLGALAVGASLLTVAGAAAAPRIAPIRSSVEVVQTTADLSQRLTRLPDLHFGTTARPRSLPVIRVNDRVSYQRVTGFGGAMTDTSAWLIERGLSRATAAMLSNELFGTHGIHLSFLRVPIGASDYTQDGMPYSYDDLPAGQTDPSLAQFSIAHDRAYVLPALRKALAINPRVEVIADPWSPPAWMKANDSLNNFHFGGTLLPSAYGPLADYFVKFLQAYALSGVPVAAISPQNEPTVPAWPRPGLNLPEVDEATFVLGALRPALRAAGLRTEIYGSDLGWGSHSYATNLAATPARSALAGIAWHCYNGNPNVMSAAHRLAPALDQLVNECATGITPFAVSAMVIASLRNWASAVALWNLALDPSGGPVQEPNNGCVACTGLVTVDAQTGSVAFSLAYYELGQESKFIEPGARRIASGHFVTYRYRPPVFGLSTPGLDDVALRNPDGSEVVVAYNSSAKAVRFAVEWHGRSLSHTLPPDATVTFAWNRTA